VDKSRPLPSVLRETDALGRELTSYVYGNGLLGLSRPTGGPLFYHQDAQASVRQLTDAAGTVSASYTYDAFGNVVDSTNPTASRYRFAGEALDPQTNLVYLRARYYDARTGRFITRDPFDGVPSAPATLHRYVYAQGDPINRRDPSGLFGLEGLSFDLSSIAQANPLTAPQTARLITTVAAPLEMAGKMVNAVQMHGFPDQGLGSYSRWFENPLLIGIPSYASAVKGTWDTLANLAGKLTVDMFTDGPSSDPRDSLKCGSRGGGDTVAYTLGDAQLHIYLCDKFFNPKTVVGPFVGIHTKIGPVEGRARIIVHELAHETYDSSSVVVNLIGVNDAGYGVADCLNLAHPPVAQAKNNADNYALQALELWLGRELK
jgi:RHS repeat-associated protein